MDYKSKQIPKLSSIDLLERRVIYLDGDIDDECARDIIKKLLKLDIQSHKDITMYINSSGGSVASSLAIYDVMNMIKSNVSTIGIGKFNYKFIRDEELTLKIYINKQR